MIWGGGGGDAFEENEERQKVATTYAQKTIRSPRFGVSILHKKNSVEEVERAEKGKKRERWIQIHKN